MPAASGSVAGVRPVRVPAASVAGCDSSGVGGSAVVMVGMVGRSGGACDAERLTLLVLSCKQLISC